MDWTVGNQVTHPAKPEWGLGKVVAVLGDDKLRIRFKNVGEKLLKGAPLVLVSKVTTVEATPGVAKGRLSIADYKEAFLVRLCQKAVRISVGNRATPSDRF